MTIGDSAKSVSFDISGHIEGHRSAEGPGRVAIATSNITHGFVFNNGDNFEMTLTLMDHGGIEVPDPGEYVIGSSPQEADVSVGFQSFSDGDRENAVLYSPFGDHTGKLVLTESTANSATGTFEFQAVQYTTEGMPEPIEGTEIQVTNGEFTIQP